MGYGGKKYAPDGSNLEVFAGINHLDSSKNWRKMLTINKSGFLLEEIIHVEMGLGRVVFIGY